MGIYQAIGIGAAAVAVGIVLENTAPLIVMEDTLQRTAALPKLPRIVQISDLHRKTFGAHNTRLIRKVQSLHPELIAITGDLVSRSVTDFSETERLLWALRGIAPIVMVPGNHELDLPPTLYDRYRLMAQRCGAQYLENDTVMLDGVPFSGITLTSAHYRTKNGYRDLSSCTADDLTAALGHCLPGTVLLAHNPLFLEAYAEWGAALVLAGHMHGGMIHIPKVGGLISPERKFFPKYDKGQYTLGQTTMIVSSGLGKLRLGVPPELRVISLAEDGQKA